MSEEELEALLDRVRAGDNDACNQILDLCGDEIMREIRRCLWMPLRKRVGSWDIYQEVFCAFFMKHVHQQEFATSQELLRYLAGSVHHVIQRLHRHHCETAKRSVRREVGLDSDTVSEEDLQDRRQAFTNELALQEYCVRMISRLPDADQDIGKMLLQGDKLNFIAETLEVSISRVYMVRRVLQKRLAPAAWYVPTL
jgi:hypothetical protein